MCPNGITDSPGNFSAIPSTRACTLGYRRGTREEEETRGHVLYLEVFAKLFLG